MNVSSNIIKQIKLLGVSNSNINRYLQNHYPHIYLKLCNTTDFLKDYYNNIKIPILARFYCVENNITEINKCRICGKPTRFINETEGFAKWCSIRCSCLDNETIKKSKMTRLEKYGNANFSNKAKSNITRAKKLKENPNYYKDITKKCKATKLKNHGNANFVNVEKCKKTKLEKYGSENYNNIEKNLKTKEEKYGYKHYNNREKFIKTLDTFSKEKKIEINLKRKITNLEKYGVEHYTQTEECRQKTSNTNLKKYGVKCTLQLDIAKNNALEYNLNHTWNMITNHEKYIPQFDFEYYKNNKSNNIEFKWKCKNCNHIFYAFWKDGNVRKRCPNCEPKLNMISQTELYNFICENYNKTIITNTKNVIKPLELDLYLPDINLAIEYDGMYWHSADRKPKNYHLNKTEECEKMGIQLIHIFEDEWIYKKDIVKNRLKNLLGIYSKKIYARNCTIKEITSEMSLDFQDRNHIQGKVKSPINIGLYYGDELVSLMTFSKCRFNKNYQYELVRFCSESNYHIIGAAGKLLKYFERTYKPKSIVSYADRRWSKGNLYTQLGFTFINKSAVNYWYIKNGSDFRESRISYQKHKLSSKLENFDSTLTEAENMKNNGYSKIYDCGNLVFIKTF